MLGSGDVDRAVAFYRDVLGLTATTLAITGVLEPAGSGPATHECVFGVESVTATYESLKERVAFVNEPRVVSGDSWGVNFRDPDGHQCSFYGPR